MNDLRHAHGRGPDPRHPRSVRRAAAALACTVLLLSTGARPAQDANGVDDARAALEKWVETRRIISQERRDWALGKELLEDRIELVLHEIEALRAKIADAQESIAEADRKRAERMEEKERLDRTAGVLSDGIATLEGRTRGLLARLPDPIRERIKPLSQRLPEDSAQTKSSLSERFQNVVGMLNEVDKFHRDITVTSEVRPLPSGVSAEVTALYVGIGRGYYVGAEGAVAGVGSASEDGWVWTPANDAAPEIAVAVAILKNEQEARFVRLPMRVE